MQKVNWAAIGCFLLTIALLCGWLVNSAYAIDLKNTQGALKALEENSQAIAARKALRSPGIGAVLDGASFANYAKQPNFRRVNDIVEAYGARPHAPGVSPYLELEEEGSLIILNFDAFHLKVDRNERYFHENFRRALEQAAVTRLERHMQGMSDES